MNLSNNPLDLIIDLYQALDNRQVEGRTVSGNLPERYDYAQVEERLERFNLIGACTEPCIEFRLPNADSGYFFLDIDELLGKPDYRAKQPERFFLADIEFYSDAQQRPALVRSYLDIVGLVNAFERVSDHVHRLPNGTIRLVFLDGTKVEIDVDYAKNDLKEIANINRFIESYVSDTMHQEQKKAIIRSSLRECLSEEGGAHQPIPLSKLLAVFDSFFAKVKHGYDLYVSEFSFKKIKDEVEREKVDLINKINAIFSGIQNQLLAIPVALVLIGSQLKLVAEPNLNNAVVFLGGLVFAFLMSLLIRNQRHTLKAIKSEYERQKDKIFAEHQLVANKFSDVYDELDERYRAQERLIVSVDVLVAFSLLIAILIMIFASVKPAEFIGVATKIFSIGAVLNVVLFWLLPKMSKRFAI